MNDQAKSLLFELHVGWAMNHLSVINDQIDTLNSFSNINLMDIIGVMHKERAALIRKDPHYAAAAARLMAGDEPPPYLDQTDKVEHRMITLAQLREDILKVEPRIEFTEDALKAAFEASQGDLFEDYDELIQTLLEHLRRMDWSPLDELERILQSKISQSTQPDGPTPLTEAVLRWRSESSGHRLAGRNKRLAEAVDQILGPEPHSPLDQLLDALKSWMVEIPDPKRQGKFEAEELYRKAKAYFDGAL
jgi:hypothetical protein